MTDLYVAPLPDRRILEISGPEKAAFLQGLITNDVETLSPSRAIYAALLSPQGKVLADFFIADLQGTLLLDCDVSVSAMLLKRLTMYKLRAQVTINLVEDWRVAALFGDETTLTDGDATQMDGAVIFSDPRFAGLGSRIVSKNIDKTLADGEIDAKPAIPDAYKAHRISLGVAEGPEELGIEQMFALEANLAELNGVDFKKGCYVGQELTARMKHKTTLRKRIVPLVASSTLPSAPAAVTAGGKELGTLCVTSDTQSLGLVRLDRLEAATADGQVVQVGDTKLTPTNPPWLEIF